MEMQVGSHKCSGVKGLWFTFGRVHTKAKGFE